MSYVLEFTKVALADIEKPQKPPELFYTALFSTWLNEKL